MRQAEPAGQPVGACASSPDRKAVQLDAALRLHAYLVREHWDGPALRGPDCGVRFNYRIGRFVKGYLPFVHWRDTYAYLQAQAYWVLANWRLHELTGEEAFAGPAVAASRWMAEQQREDGSWLYPNREWAGRVATAEGTWASIGLLESYRRTGDAVFLAAARQWHDHVERVVGYRPAAGGLAVEYFAGRPGAAVPNNSAFLLRFLAALAHVEDSLRPLAPAAALVRFLAGSQLPSGELPYTVADPRPNRTHFQCVQYNAFEAIDLLEYHRMTGDPSVEPIVTRLMPFVFAGADRRGRAFYDCGRGRRAVVYHSAARAAALALAARQGAAPCGAPIDGIDGTQAAAAARRGFDWVVSWQRADGSLPFSVCEHGVLRDRRPYPRNLAMILLHLLTPTC